MSRAAADHARRIILLDRSDLIVRALFASRNLLFRELESERLRFFDVDLLHQRFSCRKLLLRADLRVAQLHALIVLRAHIEHDPVFRNARLYAVAGDCCCISLEAVHACAVLLQRYDQEDRNRNHDRGDHPDQDVAGGFLLAVTALFLLAHWYLLVFRNEIL